MIAKRLLAGGLTVLLAAAAAAEKALPPENLVYCTVCHGADMKGNAVIEAPRLSGMDGWYIERQLTAFRNGWRGAKEEDTAGMEMRPMAAALGDEEIAQAAAYVAATMSPPPEPTIHGDTARGRRLYETCAACHGAAGDGQPELGAPALTGLDDWYLARQLASFQGGLRGSVEEDLAGRQMAAAAATLADEQDILDVVAYINTLNPDEEPR